jgi:hypothetical protein
MLDITNVYFRYLSVVIVLVNKMPLGYLKAEQTNFPAHQLYFMSLYGKLDIEARLGEKCTSGLTQAETSYLTISWNKDTYRFYFFSTG